MSLGRPWISALARANKTSQKRRQMRQKDSLQELTPNNRFNGEEGSVTKSGQPHVLAHLRTQWHTWRLRHADAVIS